MQSGANHIVMIMHMAMIYIFNYYTTHLQLSATHHVPMVLVSVWPTTHAAVLLGTLGTRALNKVNCTAHTQLFLSTCLVNIHDLCYGTSISGYDVWGILTLKPCERL